MSPLLKFSLKSIWAHFTVVLQADCLFRSGDQIIDTRFTGSMDSFVYHGEVSVDLGNSSREAVLVEIAFPSAKIRVVARSKRLASSREGMAYPRFRGAWRRKNYLRTKLMTMLRCYGGCHG